MRVAVATTPPSVCITNEIFQRLPQLVLRTPWPNSRSRYLGHPAVDRRSAARPRVAPDGQLHRRPDRRDGHPRQQVVCAEPRDAQLVAKPNASDGAANAGDRSLARAALPLGSDVACNMTPMVADYRSRNKKRNSTQKTADAARTNEIRQPLSDTRPRIKIDRRAVSRGTGKRP
ncbi:MAG: hypothetical protein ABFC63_01940 [Thermoguttaceae bacterium]